MSASPSLLRRAQIEKLWYVVRRYSLLVHGQQNRCCRFRPVVLPRRTEVRGSRRKGWDYISVDSAARRLYVSHGTQLEVLDADTGKLVGRVLDTPGVHSAAFAPELKKGITGQRARQIRDHFRYGDVEAY